MTIVWFIAIVAVAFVAYLYIRDSLPAHINQRFQQVLPLVGELYRRGYDQGYIVVKLRNRPEFVQLSKHIGQSERVRLTMDFPIAPWSERYKESLASLLREWNVEFAEVPREENISFVIAELGDDVGKCERLMEAVFEDVFGVSTRARRFNVDFDGVSPYEERIGL